MFHRRLAIPLLAGLLILALATCATAQTPTTHPMVDSCFPSLASAIRIKGPITFCNEFVPIHIPDVRERLEKELLLMLWDRAQVILWLKRTGRYFPHIEVILSSAGLPDDLKYIAVIESALKPHAGSGRGARGIWQFIPSTARNYDLTVDRYIDERRNFHLATRAATKYFRDLHDMFGSWTLSCAAYNMGEQGLQRRIDLQEVKDYYYLDLPTETERYILRAVAAKLILSDPMRYGFDLKPEDFYTPRKFDRVRLKHKEAAPVSIIAKASGTYYKTIRDMNPQILGSSIPGGDNIIFLPEGASKEFSKRYKPLIAKYRADTRTRTYIVQRGDSLALIAEKNKISLWQLLKLNKLKKRSIIHPGQTLVIEK